MEAHLNTGPELIALRKTNFYLRLRPFIKGRAVQAGVATDFLLRDEDDSKLNATDRFYFGLEFIFGDLFRNVRSRRWIKATLQKKTEEDFVDEVGAHFLHRAYLNELVVVLERLQRMIALLAKSVELSDFAQRAGVEVLQFFNPLLLEKRNANHHNLYMGYPRSYEVESLLNRREGAEALQVFRGVMGKEIDWMNHSERELAKFLAGFLDRVYSQLKIGDSYFEPVRLPADFSLSSRFEAKLRKKHNHAKVFREANS